MRLVLSDEQQMLRDLSLCRRGFLHLSFARLPACLPT